MKTGSSKSAAERQRECRQRKRDRGEPLVHVFDSALREAVFAEYRAGNLCIDIPDLVRSVVDRVAADGGGSERG